MESSSPFANFTLQDGGGNVFGLFPIDFRKVLLIIFVIALPLISINIQRNPGEDPWYLKPVTAVTNVIQLGFSKLVFVVKDTTGQYLNLVDIKKENRLLKEKLSYMESQWVVLEEIKKENDRILGLLEFKAREPMDLVAAKVISFDLNSQYATVKINRGSQDKIQRGLAVVTPVGVVGTILEVGEHVSSVLVLTDRYSVIDATVSRSRARGVVEGKTQTTAQLKYLQRTDDVVVGDLIVTSGLDSILPQGFPIGRVFSVEKKPYGVTQSVELEPMIDASQLEEVFVVLRVRAQPAVANAELATGEAKNEKK